MADDDVEMTSAQELEQKPVTVPAAVDPAPPAAPAEGAAPEGEAAAPAAQPEGDNKQPQKPNAFQARIDKLTKDKYDLAREKEAIARDKAALEVKLAQLEQSHQKPADGAAPAPKPAPPAQDVESLANQRAQQIYQQRVYQERVDSVVTAGKKDFADFNQRCNVLADLGANERPDFMEIVTDPTIVPDGHKVLASLAGDPDEAARILSLPTVRMSAELARYAERVAKPQTKAAAISKVPDPIKPLNGAAVANTDPSDDDAEPDWYQKRQAQRAQRKQVGRSL